MQADTLPPMQQQAWAAQSPQISASRVVDANDIVYAGFARRFAALFLDGMILIVPVFVIAFLLGMVLGIVFRDDDPQTLRVIGQCTGFATAILIRLVYFAFQESSPHQATFGKRALGIKVTDESGQRLTFGRAAGRFFASALSYLTLYVGFLMAGFTDRKRALHDMVAGTLVVDRWAYTEFPERQQRSASGCLIAIIIAVCCVIPVTGILAAIAIPAYQDYVIRSQVSDGAMLADGPKNAVAQYYFAHGEWPADNAQAGIAQADAIHDQYVTRLAITNGVIAITYGDKADTMIAGRVLAFAPQARPAAVNYTCDSAAGSTIDDRFRAVACRH